MGNGTKKNPKSDKSISKIKLIFANKDNWVCTLRKPFYFGWLMSGASINSFIKISLFFILLWFAGYVTTSSENALFIEDGNVSVLYNNDSLNINDNFDLADNHCELSLIKKSENSYFFKIDINNRNKNLSTFNCGKDIYLKKKNFMDRESRIDTIAMGRKFNFLFKEKENSLHVDISVNGLGYLQDYANYLYLLGLILALYFFRILNEKFIFAFTGNNKISDCSNLDLNHDAGLLRILNFKERAAYKNKIESIINSLALNKHRMMFYIFWFLFFAISIILSFRQFTFQNTPDGNWNFSPDVYPKSFVYSQIKDIIIWVFIIPPLLYRIFIIFYNTVKFSFNWDKEEAYQINVLSYDNAGGLSPLGEVTLLQFYMFIVFFPHVYTAAYLLNFPNYLNVLLPLYLIFTFCLFFIPLSSPHKSMKKAKQRALDELSIYYNQLNEHYSEEIKKGDSVKDSYLEEIYDKMKKVKTLYQERKKMPVWPYDFEIFLKFGAVFLTNLIIYLSEFIISFYR